MDAGSIVVIGTAASLAAGGGATSLGALPVFTPWRLSARMQDALLGFAAGVMLSASFFSLIVPALEAAEALHGTRSAAALLVVAGILLGAGGVWAIDRIAPHQHFIQGREGSDIIKLRKIWLFVIAITIHNFPEGLAVGVGFGGGDIAKGTSLAIGIGLQNIPEGLAVAVALSGEGYTRLYAFTVAALSGLVEPVGGFVGAFAVTSSEPMLPWGLAFAAGAMLYVISHEIIPETHRRGFQNQATTGLMIGLCLMLFLDVTLG